LKWACVANTGEGKTLAIVLKIRELLKKNPYRQVYANFHINLPNCHFTPVMFLPFDDLKDCIIAYDDVSSQEVLERFIGVCANRSRKKRMELMFTCQYYSMIPRKVRRIIDYRIFPELDKKNDTLRVQILQKKVGLLKPEIYHDVIKYVKKTEIYDTEEVVDDPTESEVIAEIVKISNTPRDIEKNLMIYTGNKAERKALYKEIYELKGFDKEEKEALRKKKEKEAKIRQEKYINQKKELVNYLVDTIRLNESKTYIYGKLYERLDTLESSVLVQFDDFREIIMRAIAIFRDREILNSPGIEEKNSSEEKTKLQNYTTDPNKLTISQKIIKWLELKGKSSIKEISIGINSKHNSVKAELYKNQMFVKIEEKVYTLKGSIFDINS